MAEWSQVFCRPPPPVLLKTARLFTCQPEKGCFLKRNYHVIISADGREWEWEWERDGRSGGCWRPPDAVSLTASWISARARGSYLENRCLGERRPDLRSDLLMFRPGQGSGQTEGGAGKGLVRNAGRKPGSRAGWRCALRPCGSDTNNTRRLNSWRAWNSATWVFEVFLKLLVSRLEAGPMSIRQQGVHEGMGSVTLCFPYYPMRGTFLKSRHDVN